MILFINYNLGFFLWFKSIIMDLEVIEVKGLGSEERYVIVFWIEVMLKGFIYFFFFCNIFS